MWARRVLAPLTTLLIVAAAVAGYARAELADREAFTARAVSAFDEQSVRVVVAGRVTDRLARDVTPDVLAVRPLLVSGLDALMATPQFARVVALAARGAHDQLLGGEASYVVALGPSTPIVDDALRSLAPQVARALPDDLRVEVVSLNPDSALLRGARATNDLADLWWVFLIAAVAAAAGLAAVSRGVREAVAALGTVVIAAGLTVAVAMTVLGLAVAGHAEGERRAAREALWSALVGDLRTAALLGALGGLAMVVVASRTPGPDLVAAATRRARDAATSQRTSARLGRAGVLAAVGVGLIVAPETVDRIATVLGGAALLLLAAAQVRPRAPARDAPPIRPSRLAAAALAGPAVVILVAVLFVLPAPTDPPADRADPASGCNGSKELCDRRLNDVAFPATHNSYAAADEPGWLFANQRHGIELQLRDGIRGLLIDVHPGVLDRERGRVRTDLEAEGGSRNKVARALGPEALRVADRLAGRVGGPLTGERQAYLCHTLCELGAEPLGEQLQLIRTFLDRNPSEVVVLFVEPYVPVEPIERALNDAKLLREAAELERDEPLPTLGDLIRAKTRLVVLTEEDGGTRPWYLPGFTFAQDTPLGATTGAELKCERFRGDDNSPLFLLNHWIDTFPPSPTRNGRIGGPFLRDRLDRCGRERALVPNLVAVDFYERTDVVELAAALNARR